MQDIVQNMQPITRKDMGLPEREGLLVANGKARTLEQWERVTGIPKKTLQTRLARGMTPEQAVTAPYVSRKGRV